MAFHHPYHLSCSAWVAVILLILGTFTGLLMPARTSYSVMVVEEMLLLYLSHRNPARKASSLLKVRMRLGSILIE